MLAGISNPAEFTAMRNGAEQYDPETIRQVASQFEALFIESLLKNMRSAELADPLFGASDQHKLYQEMMDQQLAQKMSTGAGIGLAEMLVRQLGGETAPVQPTTESFLIPAVPAARTNGRQDWDSAESFVRDLLPHAERVARRLNVAPEGIVAQAALETGWGVHVPKRANGASSNNLFGIKAGSDWTGGTVSRTTVEYVDGVAERRVERFRAYPDINTAFNDYVRLIEGNPRYQAVLESGQDAERFAKALQVSGYATDPLYAAKITRVLGSDTMRAAINEPGLY
jgi:flagellar protein FlgJ